jgi:hypothetical protein
MELSTYQEILCNGSTLDSWIYMYIIIIILCSLYVLSILHITAFFISCHRPSNSDFSYGYTIINHWKDEAASKSGIFLNDKHV